MAFTACSKRVECPKQVYPVLIAIDKIPIAKITVKNNSLDSKNTITAFNAIRSLRVSENYYYGLITDYQKTFGGKNE